MAALATPVTDPTELDKVHGLFLKKLPIPAASYPTRPKKVAPFRMTSQVISVLD